MCIAGLTYILYMLLSDSYTFEQPIPIASIFILFSMFLIYLIVGIIKKIGLPFLIKFENDHIIYNDYRKSEKTKIEYNTINSVEMTYDGKFIELKFTNTKKEPLLISIEDINENISKVLRTFKNKVD